MLHFVGRRKRKRTQPGGSWGIFSARGGNEHPGRSRLAALMRRRRTPGLRREEVAALAGISVDWYASPPSRGAEIFPSRPTAESLARARSGWGRPNAAPSPAPRHRRSRNGPSVGSEVPPCDRAARPGTSHAGIRRQARFTTSSPAGTAQPCGSSVTSEMIPEAERNTLYQMFAALRSARHTRTEKRMRVIFSSDSGQRLISGPTRPSSLA